MLAGLLVASDFRRKFGVFLLGGLLALASSTFAQAQFKVPGTHATIQEAVDACPAAGCVISLSDALYKLPNTLLIYEKSNLTIKGALGVKPVIQFQDKGLLAGPFFSAADAANQPAGWKQWPLNNSTAVGGSKNTSNPYSTSGYQQNGAILIKQSSNITLENLVVDGVAPIPVGHLGIWDPDGNPTLLGNFGVNLFLSKEVTLRNTKIQNCFSGMYIFGRNKGGAMARDNKADLDKDQLLPNSQFGYSGQHMVEYSELADNIWGVYVESDWDLGSTFHHNLVYNNYNRDFTAWMACVPGAQTGAVCAATAPAAIKNNSEAGNQAGGFMYGKDFVTVAYKIYNNTFYRNASIFGWGQWRATTQHVVYNNLIANMYLDYNTSRTGLKSDNFRKYFSNVDLISKYTDGIYNNTFAIFPEKVSINSMKVTDSAATTLARSDLVFPDPRLQVQVQTQKLTWNFQATQYTPPGATTGTYINLATPFKDSVLYWSQANVQYQKTERNFPFNGWELSVPALPPAKFPTKTYSVLGKLFGIVGTNNNQLPAGVQIGDTIPIMDQANQQQWTALDSAYVTTLRTTWTDTLGTIDTIAKKDVRKQTNWFIKSVAFQSTDPKSPKFLEPVWEDAGVDSVILDHGRWGVDPDGSIADVGAKSKSKGTAPSILLKDGTQAKYDSVANTIRFSFDLVETGGNFVSYQYYIFSYASAVSDDDNPTLPYNPKDLALSSIISGAPKPGSNGFEAKLPIKPDPRSRYQVMVIAQTASGATVYSNMGTWLYKNDGFDMNVMFFDKTTGAQITSARVGQTVVMKVRPVVSRDVTIRLVSGIKYNCRDLSSGVLTNLGLSSKDSAQKVCTGTTKRVVADTSFRDSLDAGKKTANVYTGTLQMVQIRATGLHDVINGGAVVDPTDIFRTNVKGETAYDVFFTVAGPQIVGANGKDTIGVAGKKASFSGDGKILIRPGLPYLAQFQDPPSVSLADTGFMTQNARVPVKVTVFDSVGNLVDTSSNIAIEITTTLGGVSVVGGDLSAKTMNLHLDSATGVFWARTFDSVGSVFYLKSQVVVRDSARVKVTPPKEALKWTYAAGDSIFRYLGQSATISLTLIDGNGAPALDASAPPFTATLTVAPGLRLALPSKPDSAITSIDILRAGTASVNLVVLSDGPVSAGSLAATNPALDDAATFQPVTFMPPPVPPTPSVDSAVFRDVDCDGAADHVRIYFKKDPVRRLKDSIQVTGVMVKLPFASQAVLGAATKVVDADSSILDVALTTPVLGTNPKGSVSVQLRLKRLSLGDTLVSALATGKSDTVFGVADRVGPRLVPRAVIWENSLGNPRDTLRFVVSEPVTYTKPIFPLLVWNGGVWKKTAATVLNAKSGVSSDTIELDVQGNDGLLVEKAVVRLDPAADLVDASGNHADDCAGATDTLLVYVKPIPMVSAAIVDVDGNGAADQIHVRFAAKLSKAAHFPDSLVVSDWCDFCGTRSVKLGASSDSINFAIDIVPFEVGKTTGMGLAGQGVLTFRSPMQNQLVDLVDSVGPIPMTAALRFGSGADTLRVTFSEPVSQLAGGTYLMHQSGLPLGLTASNPVASTNWTFAVPTTASPYPAVGDSVYLPNLASRLVGVGGVIPTTVSHPPRVVVQGGDRVPDSALVLDRNADGTADAVQLFYSSPLRGNPLYTFIWGGTTVTVDSKAHGAKDSVILTLPVVGFLPMVTGDPSASGSTQSLVAGALEPAQSFLLRDRVPPVIDSVFVSYGQVEGTPDTMRVWTSEPIFAPQLNTFLGIESRGVRKPFAGNESGKIQGAGPFLITCTGCIETATAFGLPSWPDRARLQAGIMDNGLNAVGDSSVWVTVFNGLFPTRYRVSLYPKGGVQDAVVPDDAPIKKLPPVSAFILPGSTAPDALWMPIGTTADAMGLAGNPAVTNAVGQAGFYGLLVEMNTSFDGDFLAYDNLGVYVGKQNIRIDIEELRAKGMLVGGKYTLAVVMNGSNMVGKPVSSGVYMIRLISYGKQNVNGIQVRAMLENKIFKVGYHRKK
ncbi:MAG: hypothetical protein IPO40_03190 [Fibrobacteres bacterium]|nr:hypothetical protein [Fibrobacterota bacterium]